MERFSFNNKTALLLILAVVSCLMLPMAFLGIPENYDLLQHIRFANTYLQSFNDGHLIPVWGSDDNFGLGSIGVRFYPPLVYVFLALTRALIGNWYDAFWMDSFFWMFVGCVGIYYWTKEWLSEPQAFFAAL